jgi:cell division protein FtsL
MNQIAVASRLLEAQRAYTKCDSGLDQSLWRFCLGLAFVVLAGVMCVWIHVQVVKIGYEINALERMKQGLVANNEALRVDINLLKSPERLEKVATETLGLKLPEERQFIYLESRALNILAAAQ